MINNLGNSLQLLAIICHLLTIIQVLYFKCARVYSLQSSLSVASFAEGPLGLNRSMLTTFLVGSGAVILAFFALVYGFVVSDFSVQNIFLNSSTIKPLIFKISAAWASHEGSILLWLCLLNCVALAALYFAPKEAREYKVAIISTIQLLFCSFIYFTSNPFIALSFMPQEGLGLNPILQDEALAIHPPTLYLGYVSYFVPFLSACVILLKPDNEALQMQLLKLAKSFSSFGLIFLTIGVGLGSWWAYRELGWGGFWFFDPVENISIMPWLSAIALHHSLMISIKSKRLMSWSLSLAILTFILVVLGTFLVRSGMLVSIHAFAASPERGLYLLAIFAAIALPSILLLSFRGEKVNNNPTITFKEAGLIAGNISFLVTILILLVATIYPIAYSILYNESISVGVDFFLKSFVPAALPIFLLAGIFCSKSKQRKHFIITLLSVTLALAMHYKHECSLIASLAFAASSFLLLQTIHIMLVKSEFFRKKLSSKAVAMLLGHFGFGLLALSITLNSILHQEIDFIGKAGDTIKASKFEVHLKTIKFAEGSNYYRQIAEFWITDDNKNITILKPENRLYKVEKTLSQESDIYSYLTYDMYVVLSKIDGDMIYAKVYYQPYISFVWLSVLLIAVGFLITLL